MTGHNDHAAEELIIPHNYRKFVITIYNILHSYNYSAIPIVLVLHIIYYYIYTTKNIFQTINFLI